MYGITLWLHSLLRWALLLVLLFQIGQTFTGWFQKKEWTPLHKRGNLLVLIFSHLQLVLGLALYFGLSPLGSSSFKSGMKVVMKNRLLRFWAVEHITLMLLALVFVQVGFSISKRKEDSLTKHKTSAIWFTVALIAIFLAIPWPFLSTGMGRPWLRIMP
ncbi:MAG: cytochrome B [Myxococcales bacterium]|nr:cytochrome B [Myxococcales bacterium]MCB9641713.1 cytochrome B [Myxococcales bacterium]